MRLARVSTYTLVLIFSIGCGIKPDTAPHKQSLEEILSSLSTDTDEAQQLSTALSSCSSQLSTQYELTKPPLFHNFLVNVGIKERGLCWHFAYDMLSCAKKLNLKSFDYYIGGANIDEYWEEHNTLVTSCKGCAFEKGVVLDAWRDSGDLYFSYLKDDKKYIWTQRGGVR